MGGAALHLLGDLGDNTESVVEGDSVDGLGVEVAPVILSQSIFSGDGLGRSSSK